MQDDNAPKQSDVLIDAATVAGILEDSGRTVYGHYSNGRRVVLVIDQPPAFVRDGVCKRRQPNGRGGWMRVMAAGFQGVQIEWLENEESNREVANG